MRRSHFAVAGLVATLAGLFAPGTAPAVVVVRHPVYRPVAAVAAVVVVAAIVAKPPATPPPPPTAPPPPPISSALPLDTTMWTLPSGCLKVNVKGEALYQCGPSWLKQQQCEQGPYFQVVAAP